jgi:hypothetical protein
METENLLKDHVIDISAECPICYEETSLDYHCDSCGWESCDECSQKWRIISNTCPQCRMELEDIKNAEDEQSTSVVKLILKVAAIFFIFYISFIFVFINYDVFDCKDDDGMCIFMAIFIYGLILCGALDVCQKILRR